MLSTRCRTPLTDQLVSAQSNVPAPSYREDVPALDLKSVFEDAFGSQDVLSDWPQQPKTQMDTTQVEALRRILTKQVAIIQGPPGTGKTFVSVCMSFGETMLLT